MARVRVRHRNTFRLESGIRLASLQDEGERCTCGKC